MKASDSVAESRFFFLRLSAFTNFLVILMLLDLALIYPDTITLLSDGQIQIINGMIQISYSQVDDTVTADDL